MGALSNLITIVVGPTGSGKSSWALAEAERVHGAIVNADSVQIYKHFNIGAAKPSEVDMAKVPHHLYSFIDPHDSFTAGDYRRSALALIHEHIEKMPLIIVGGSGFYIQALDRGMYEVKPISPEVDAIVKSLMQDQKGFAELTRLDPKAAQKINPNDPYRIERALKTVISEGRTIDEIQKEFALKNESLGKMFRLQKIGLLVDRDHLRARVRKRTEQMLASGLIEEVKNLMALGFSAARPMQSVGYKEVQEFLAGHLNREQLFESIVTSTMQLAKRQMTWFKRDPEIKWIESHAND